MSTQPQKLASPAWRSPSSGLARKLAATSAVCTVALYASGSEQVRCALAGIATGTVAVRLRARWVTITDTAISVGTVTEIAQTPMGSSRAIQAATGRAASTPEHTA